MEILIEKMAVNLWQQRRVLIAEVAAIEEVRNGYTHRTEKSELTQKVELVVVHAGEENYEVTGLN